jgi:hypothetical protein
MQIFESKTSDPVSDPDLARQALADQDSAK